MKIKAVHHAVGWFCLAIVATQIANAEQIATAWGPHDAAWSDESVEQIFHDLRQSEVVLPCDTWVMLPNATKSGTTILAKNSDRTLFDCQPLLFHPARTWPEEATVDLGRLTIPQAPRTYATLGSSPYWCWGYEHGINEHGVAIGNEGIRTKVLAADLAAFAQNKPPPIGPTGMDLLRVALERAATAEEALDVITELLEAHGQFGTGLPAMPSDVGAYENSFIIADPHEAWVLETAGRQWVARKFTQGTTSISNTLTIGQQFDRSSADLESYAVKQGWWPAAKSEKEAAFNFTTAYLDDAPDRFAAVARSRIRQQCSANLLQSTSEITPQWMMRIARDRSTSPSLDLDQTASSCVAFLPAEGIAVFWWCPATPSNSCYVPFFVDGTQIPEFVSTAGTVGRVITAPSEVQPDRFAAGSYWWQFRDLCDKVRRDYAERNPQVRAVFDPLEQEFASELKKVLDTATSLRAAGDEAEARATLDRFSAACAERALAVAEELRKRFAGEEVAVPERYQPYVGTYLATIKRENVEVLVQNDHLAVILPGRGVLELKEPDAEGKRYFALTDQAAISFDQDDLGIVVGMHLHQADLNFELIRKGIEIPPEIELAKLQAYLGKYHHEPSDSDVTVIIQNNRLALDWPARQVILELHPPDAHSAWTLRLDKSAALRFHVDDEGVVKSFDLLRGGTVETNLPRVD